jgi:hypothetical protein
MRGFGVLASWILWPPFFFGLYWLVSVMLATGRRCSIEGCDAPDGFLGLLWLAAMFGPPIVLTYRWIQWRRQHRSPAA